VPLDGASVHVEPFVKSVLTVNEVLAVTEVDEQEVVRLLNDNNVPELVIVPPPLMVIVPEVGDKVQVAPFVKVSLTVKLVSAVTAVEEHDVVRLLKESKVPELTMAPPPLTVTVPDVGE